MESRARSLSKALSWRLIALLITMAVGYLFTESAAFALSIGLADSLVKIVAYYLHERAWISVPAMRSRKESEPVRPAAG